ncbi:unnamed protein product, partial [Polarella glacialis]
VLLAGPGAWSQSVVSEALDRWRSMAEGPGLRVLRADVREPSAKAWMGQELDVVVLSAHRRRFLDSFGAVCGALRGGGVLLLETPAFEDWKRQRLGVRWCRLLEKVQLDPAVSPWITVCGDGQAIPDLVRPLQERRKRPVDEELKPNQEQRKLLEAVLQVTGSGPLCVYGRRGRGKSAGLGMAAAVLLQRTGGTILVTSPSQPATRKLFEAAERYLGSESGVKRLGPYSLRLGKRGSLEFVNPSELSKPEGQHRLKQAHFLIVDEAAGLPVNFLVELLKSAGRVALATTLDGYEGSGNGFLVRCLPRLRAVKPGLQLLELSSSFRWAAGCPLEALSRSALLLDAAPAELGAEWAVQAAQCARMERMDRNSLVGGDERPLRELYGLLRHGHLSAPIGGHYKTKPSDLETFLDAKGVIWLAMRHEGQNLGLTIAGLEEPIEEPSTARELWLRQRQVPQKLTAQTLAREAGFLEAAELRYVRMMRWCLHPQLKGLGLGKRLLVESLAQLKGLEGVDAIAAHFGATAWLIKLWLSQGAKVVWLSHSCDPSSGQHSVSVLIPLSERAERLTQRLQLRLAAQLLELLSGPLHDLEADALRELLKSFKAPQAAELWRLSAEDHSDVWSFAWGARNLSNCRHALLKAALDFFRRPPPIPSGPPSSSDAKQGWGMQTADSKESSKDEELLLDLLQGRTIRSEERLRYAVRRLPQAEFQPHQRGSEMV